MIKMRNCPKLIHQAKLPHQKKTNNACTPPYTHSRNIPPTTTTLQQSKSTCNINLPIISKYPQQTKTFIPYALCQCSKTTSTTSQHHQLTIQINPTLNHEPSNS
jgi:hypothetical protein